MAIQPMILDADILTLGKARLAQPLTELSSEGGSGLSASGIEERNHWGRCRGQLRAPRKRPPRRCPANHSDELASPHSITSSARASNDGGTVRPSALAVFRLMTISYLVGACTGRSAGFSPLRMRSTYRAAPPADLPLPLRPVGHQPPADDKVASVVDRGQLVFRCKPNDKIAVNDR